MTFSREESLKRVQDLKLRRAKTMAKGNINPDFDLQHGNEIREYAKTGTYTELTKRVKDEITKYQETMKQRRNKLYVN